MALGLSLASIPTIFTLLPSASAKIPFNSAFKSAALKKQGSDVTFDPLGVIAILYNPRAAASAARLYTQPDIKDFRWPHMLQIGAALSPLAMLVRHLTQDYKSVHPAVDMCKDSMDNLTVTSNIVQLALFDSLPLNMSNQWLTDLLSFQPSKIAGNDFVIVDIHSISGTGAYSGQDSPNVPKTREIRRRVFICGGLIRSFEGVMGTALAAGVVFGVLLADIWAIVLFISYLWHWIASTLLSFQPMVIPDPYLTVRESEKIEYAVYERPSGGSVIFKGRRDVLEQWARTNWVFAKGFVGTGNGVTAKQDQTLQNYAAQTQAMPNVGPQNVALTHIQVPNGAIIAPGQHNVFVRANTTAQPPAVKPLKPYKGVLSKHWNWIISGTFAAIASVACMVNMGGIMQLAFLGTLAYASIAEICVTFLARRIQASSHDFGGSTIIRDKDKRYKSIIQATIGVDAAYRTTDLNWIEFDLLPGLPAFKAMLATLEYLNKPGATIEKAEGHFEAACPITPGALSGDIWAEIQRAWKIRFGTAMIQQANAT